MEHKTEAREITSLNIDTLSLISGMPKRTFEANYGWVLVRDVEEGYRFFIMPKSVFKRAYPGVTLTYMKGAE